MSYYTDDLHRKRENDAEAVILIARIDRNRQNIEKTKKAYLACFDSDNADPDRLKFLSKRYEDTISLGWRLFHRSRRMTNLRSHLIDDELMSKVRRHYLNYDDYGIR